MTLEYPLAEQIKDISIEDGEDGEDGDGEDDSGGQPPDDKGQELMEIMETKLTNDEEDILENLLVKILKYTPIERLRLNKIVTHH